MQPRASRDERLGALQAQLAQCAHHPMALRRERRVEPRARTARAARDGCDFELAGCTSAVTMPVAYPTPLAANTRY